MAESELKDKLAKVQTDIAEAAANPAPRTIVDWLRDPRQRDEIAMALPANIGVDRFLRIVITTVKESPQLMECTVPSLLGACMRAASLGLEPGPLQHCFLVPFWDNKARERRVQMILGYRGMVELSYRSGFVSSIEATTVYERDEFKAERGLHEVLRHVQCLDPDPGEVRCYYGLARYTNGGHSWLVAAPWLIEKHRGFSSNPNSPAWKDHYDAMARKTLIRIMSPMLRMSYEAAVALDDDERVYATMAEGAIESSGKELPTPAEQAPPEDPDELVNQLEESVEAAKAAAEPVAGRCEVCGGEGGQHADNCPEEPPAS